MFCQQSAQWYLCCLSNNASWSHTVQTASTQNTPTVPADYLLNLGSASIDSHLPIILVKHSTSIEIRPFPLCVYWDHNHGAGSLLMSCLLEWPPQDWIRTYTSHLSENFHKIFIIFRDTYKTFPTLCLLRSQPWGRVPLDVLSIEMTTTGLDPYPSIYAWPMDLWSLHFKAPGGCSQRVLLDSVPAGSGSVNDIMISHLTLGIVPMILV